MLPVVTAKTMRAIDKRTIDDLGIPSITMMENAGAAVIRELQKRFTDLSHKKIFIFCGTGNNGGDGFVIARHLFNHKIPVNIYLVGCFQNLKDDTKTNADAAKNIGVQILEIDENRVTKLLLYFLMDVIVLSDFVTPPFMISICDEHQIMTLATVVLQKLFDLVFKMTNARKDHTNISFVSSSNYLFIIN